MSDCEHEGFAADVAVQRLQDGGVVRNFVADISIKCDRCQLPFHFVGVPAGLSFSRPMVDVGATTMHAPISPGVAECPDRVRFEIGGAKGPWT